MRAMLASTGMDGIEGVVYLILILGGFYLAGALRVTAAYLFLGSMFGGETAAVLLLPPLASLTLGAVALRLRRRRRTAPAA